MKKERQTSSSSASYFMYLRIANPTLSGKRVLDDENVAAAGFVVTMLLAPLLHTHMYVGDVDLVGVVQPHERVLHLRTV
jgi:hypothetical protein